MSEVKWADELSWPEFAEMIKKTDVAILPVGVNEQHGYHAPLGLDSFVAEEIASRLAKKVPSILMPPVRYGCMEAVYSGSHWPGAISISAETLMSLYFDIGKELSRHGVCRLVFVNGHLCNTPILELAAYKVWNETGMAVGRLEWWMAAHHEIAGLGISSPGHANELETSLLLATGHANLVNLGKAVANPDADLSAAEREVWNLRLGFTHPSDEKYVYQSGNYGDPRKSKKEIGEKVIQATVEKGVILIEALRRFVKKQTKMKNLAF